METTDFVSSLGQLQKLENDKERRITSSFLMEGDESLMVTHRPIGEPPDRSGSIVIACLTTAYARIALYRLIDDYSDYVCYFDTGKLPPSPPPPSLLPRARMAADSVFLLLPDDIPPPPSSSCLGGLKNELGSSASVSA
jgi:hypothetical protein